MTTESKKDNWNLWCKLFGHKFVRKVCTGEQIPGVFNPLTGNSEYYVRLHVFPFCTRCGSKNAHYEDEYNVIND